MARRGEGAGRKRGVLYWAPRLISVLYIAFLTLFSLDVFSEAGRPLLWYAAAFAIHSLPSLILSAVLLLAWRRERLGGAVFAAAGVVLPLVFFRGGSLAEILGSAALFSPLMIAGALFVASPSAGRGRRRRG